MTKKLFTEKEIAQLSKNPFVTSVSSKGITYSEEFKHHFISEWTKGKYSTQIFEEAGFDRAILGKRRIQSASNRWKEAFKQEGARQIKMTLASQFQCVYNLKRIRRIMKKYGIVCPARKPNPYKRMMKATQEHRVVPNRLKRQFNQHTPWKVLLTDITYLTYSGGQRAYLSVIKDVSTGEVLAHHLSRRITMDLATDTLHKLKKNRQFKKVKDALFHSDQGANYTHPIFQQHVKKLGLNQSMSRRGNCWDNAPIESFFGHLKDEVDIKACRTFEALRREIDHYLRHYNHTRYQWNRKKMTPVQYRDHLLLAA